MDFREELLKAKYSYKIPEFIQQLLDSGIIQGVETIDGIHYINFAFQLPYEEFYNYKQEKLTTDFMICECSDVIYVGGMAVDNQYNILKGIIYPYYTDIHTRDRYKIFGQDMSSLHYIKGRPQILKQTDKLKLDDFFYTNESFVVFNLLTSFSDVWAEFALSKESYENTNRIIDKDGNGWKSGNSFYGRTRYEEDGEIVCIYEYFGSTARHDNAISISFAEKELGNESILSDIANIIYYNNSTSIQKGEDIN